jgi:hypothetical protein
MDDEPSLIPSECDFNQVVAEAVVRIGQRRVHAYLTKAARKVGWPIPAADRCRVGVGLALLVQGLESGASDHEAPY